LFEHRGLEKLSTGNIWDRTEAEKEKYRDLLFSHLGIEPDWNKLNYYILLDELF
jgi:aminoglycoside phosphotransferase